MDVDFAARFGAFDAAVDLAGFFFVVVRAGGSGGGGGGGGGIVAFTVLAAGRSNFSPMPLAIWAGLDDQGPFQE